MELKISEQAISLLCFLALGFGLGIVYDLLRLLRYSVKKALVWDGLFCALGAAGCFCLAMDKGRLGVWEIVLALLGFCMYINGISKHVFPIIYHYFQTFSRICTVFGKKILFLKKVLFK